MAVLEQVPYNHIIPVRPDEDAGAVIALNHADDILPILSCLGLGNDFGEAAQPVR
jgi:hypothetical protein